MDTPTKSIRVNFNNLPPVEQAQLYGLSFRDRCIEGATLVAVALLAAAPVLLINKIIELSI